MLQDPRALGPVPFGLQFLTYRHGRSVRHHSPNRVLRSVFVLHMERTALESTPRRCAMRLASMSRR